MHTSPLARLGVGDGGGMNVYIRELAERLAPAGVRVDLYTASNSPQPDTIDLRSGLRVRHIERAPLQTFTDSVTREITRNGGADLIHAHYWKSGVVGHALKHRLEVPLLTTFHTLAKVKAETGVAELDVLRADAEETIVGCSDSIIANDNTEAAELIRLYGADADKVVVIPPGVDNNEFSPKDRTIARTMLGLPTDRPIILFVGRIQAIKGADVAIDTVLELKRTHPDALLVIAGGPSGVDGQALLEGMHSHVNKHELQNNVRFVGPQPRDAMVQWYSAADVCLVPSRSESFGLVALEAGACGTPVVASDVGALPNVVTDGYSGYLVPSGDSNGFAHAISAVLRSTSKATELGAAGVHRAKRFDWNTTVNRTYCLYNRVMDAALLADRPEPCLSA